MQNFICDRFIVVPIPASELSADFHTGICKQAYDLIGAGSGNPMDAVHAELPELQKVLDSPSVDGVLESLLGQEYIMHSHRHLHEKFAHDLGFQHFHLGNSAYVHEVNLLAQSHFCSAPCLVFHPHPPSQCTHRAVAWPFTYPLLRHKPSAMQR